MELKKQAKSRRWQFEIVGERGNDRHVIEVMRGKEWEKLEHTTLFYPSQKQAAFFARETLRFIPYRLRNLRGVLRNQDGTKRKEFFIVQTTKGFLFFKAEGCIRHDTRKCVAFFQG